MTDTSISQIGTLALWMGYVFLGALFLTLLSAGLNRSLAWRDLFSEAPGGTQHVSRYLVVFGTMWLAARFLTAVIAKPDDPSTAMQVFAGFDIKDAAGMSSAAYLLSKVTNGQILSLFKQSQ